MQLRWSVFNFNTDTDTYSISSICHCTTAYEHLRLKRNDDQHFDFICRAEVNIPTEERLQFRLATVQQVIAIVTWYRHRHTFAYVRTFPPPYNRLWACVFKRKWRSTLSLRLLSRSQHCHREVSPISTLTAQPMIETERLHTDINDGPPGWSSTFDTAHGKYWSLIYMFHHDTDHDTTGLCVTFGGVADLKSRQLKPTSQSTTEFRHRPMIDSSNDMSGCLGEA